MINLLWTDFARAVEALSPLFLAALSWLSLRVAALINAKVHNERLHGILARLDDAVLMAVREVEQVYVSALKTGDADGNLTADERRQAKDAAIDAARSYLGERGLAELCKVLGLSYDDATRVVSARVEAAVYNLRAHPTRMLGSLLRAALNGAASPPASPNGAH